MKRVKIFLLLFTLCCALNACGTKPADDVPPPNDETSAVDIEWFNTEFFNDRSVFLCTFLFPPS